MQKNHYVQIRKTAFSLACLLSVALAGCDLASNMTDAEHVARAKDYYDKNDYSSSVIELKSALQKNGENAEARRLLGLINLTLGHGEAAEKELRRAAELGVAREALLSYLAEALQLQGKDQKVLDEIDPLSVNDPAERASLFAYRGNAWFTLKKLDKARAEYEQALAIDSRSALAKLGMARIAAAYNKFDEAFRLLQDVLETSPKDARAWSFQAELYKSRGDNERAEESYGKAIDYRRLNQTDRANRALVRIELKKLDAAKEDIQVLQKQAPNYFLTHHANGLLALVKGQYAEAQAALDESLKLNERYVPTLYYLGMAHLMQNHLSQAEQSLARFLSAFPASIKGLQAMALTKYHMKDYAAAKRLLLPVVQNLPEDVFATKLMGSIEFASGNPTEALKYLQKAVRLEPKSAEAQAQLGFAFIVNGETGKGLETLESALKLDPNFTQAEVLVVIAHLKAKEFDRAVKAVEGLKKKMPGNPLPLNLEGIVYLAQSDFGRAQTAFEEALKLKPGDYQAAYSLAQLAIRDKKLDKAQAYYEQVLKIHPEHSETLFKLATVNALEGKTAAMEVQLNQAVQADPKALAPRLALARYHLRFGDPGRSQTLMEEVRPLHGDNPELLAVLAEAQMKNRQPARALATATALASTDDKSAMAQYVLAKAYAQNQDAKGMRLALEQSLAKDPGFFPSRLAMVKLLLQEQKLPDAKKMLNGLLKERPDDADLFQMKGWFAMQERDMKGAIAAYQRALDQVPNSSIVTSLAQAQWLKGDRKEALMTLENWNKEHPKDTVAYYLHASLALAAGEKQKAQTSLEQLLAVSPDNLLALNDLAWMLSKEEPLKALEFAERAYTIAPKSPDVIDTLAVVLMDNTQNERALRLLEHAHELAPQDGSIAYHLALAQEKNAQSREAARTLKKALMRKETFDERPEAERLWKKWNAKGN
jgi:putative PEP-CTERM system TPR-repeat lipoprotein